MWKRVVVGLLVCAVCVLCLGAQVQEPTKQDREPAKGDGRLFLGAPSWEYWDVKEVRHWTSTDGYRVNETVYYTLEVCLDASGFATEFIAYDDLLNVMWDAVPPLNRRWNDFTATRPCATFGTGDLVALLKINAKWVKAIGKISFCLPDNVLPDLSWHCEGNVNATYAYTTP